MADDQGKKLDRVLEQSGEQAEEKFEKRSKSLIGKNIVAMPKGDYVANAVQGEFKDDVARLMAANQIELNNKHEAEAVDATSQYETARKQIRSKYKEELTELHNRYVSVMKAYGNKQGEKRTIDTKEEVYEFTKFGFAMLKNMNLPELVNAVGEDMIYREADEKDKKMFPVIDKLSQGQNLEPQDYSDIAERMTNLSEIDLSGLKIDPKELDETLRTISKTTVLSAAMLLDEGQRFELAQTLVREHGEKGAKIVHELTKMGYFTAVQTEEIFDKYYTTPGAARTMHEQAVGNGIYAQGQHEMAELRQEAVENLDKWFHKNFANHFLSYKNVINYEIIARAALAVAVLNIVVNLKNKDPEAVLMNVPMWGGLAAGAYIYNDVTQGGVERALTKETDVEQRKREKKEMERKFKETYTSHPQLANWFENNLDAVNTGFTVANPKKEDGPYTIMPEAMGVSGPGEKDGRNGDQCINIVSSWHRLLYFDLDKKTVKDQKTYIEDVLHKQTN